MQSSKTPLISLVMPVYNTERYLKESLDSILRQTYPHFELIIVDDGSTDHSAEILNEYAKRDSRIKLYFQKNAGVVAAANYGARKSSGVYIMRTDSDDISFDTKLEDLLRTAVENPNAVLISGNIEVIDENSEYLYRHLVPPLNEDIKRAMYIYNPIANGATLIKKDVFDEVGGYSDVFAEDFHLWIKLFQKGDFVATSTAVYRWRVNPNGLTMSNVEKTIGREKEYVKTLWEISIPSTLSRHDIKQRGDYYYKHYARRGADYKKMFLSDLTRLSVHLIKRGHIISGLHQLLTVASIGRTGLKAVLHRIRLLTRGSYHAIIRPKKIREDTGTTGR